MRQHYHREHDGCRASFPEEAEDSRRRGGSPSDPRRSELGKRANCWTTGSRVMPHSAATGRTELIASTPEILRRSPKTRTKARRIVPRLKPLRSASSSHRRARRLRSARGRDRGRKRSIALYRSRQARAKLRWLMAACVARSSTAVAATSPAIATARRTCRPPSMSSSAENCDWPPARRW